MSFWGFPKPLPKCHIFDTPFLTPPVFGPLFRGVLFDPPLKKKGTPSIYTLLHTPVHCYIPQKGGRLYTEIYPLFLEKYPLFWGVLERTSLQKMTLFGVSQKYPLRGGVPPPKNPPKRRRALPKSTEKSSGPVLSTVLPKNPLFGVKTPPILGGGGSKKGGGQKLG